MLTQNSAVSEEQETPTFILSLDEILSSLERVDFLKCDIEGSEFSLWPTIEKWHVKIEFLAMETHERLLGPEASEMLTRAKTFIEDNGLASRWRLDWP